MVTTHARAWATNHPDRKVVVLLVTDGLPEECGSTVENVAAAAREGFSGSPSIKTFVVGIGDLAAIDQFAQAGGTGKALQTSPGAAAELVAALNQVRSSALPCEYPLPGGEAEPLQADRVNLRYTPANGAASLIGAVPDSSRCDAARQREFLQTKTSRRSTCTTSFSGMCSTRSCSSGVIAVIVVPQHRHARSDSGTGTSVTMRSSKGDSFDRPGCLRFLRGFCCSAVFSGSRVSSTGGGTGTAGSDAAACSSVPPKDSTSCAVSSTHILQDMRML
jgi:hypothetical protein